MVSAMQSLFKDPEPNHFTKTKTTNAKTRTKHKG